MSSEPSKSPDCIKIPTDIMVPGSPTIMITPPSLATTFPNGLPTPPITPTATTAPRPILKTKKSTTPLSTYSPPPSSLCPDPLSPHASLQAPLKRHLTLLHPSTPSDIIQFCAIRLLSKDLPYGYSGDWRPIYEADETGEKVDLAAAGLIFDAPKGYRGRNVSQDGKGSWTDRRLEGMYRVARESYGLLELKGPGVNKF